MKSPLRRGFVTRTAVVVAAVAAASMVVYWRAQSSPSVQGPDGAVVVAVGPSSAAAAQRAGADAGPARAVAVSVEIPSVAPPVSGGEAFIDATAPKARSLADQVGSGQVGSGQVGSGQVGSGEVASGSAEPKAAAQEFPSPASAGTPYTWNDGERTLQVWLDPDLSVEVDGDGIDRDDITTETPGGAPDRGVASEQKRSKDDPVFRSESGELMALPGGVLLVLDAGWDSTAVDGFFDRNGISSSRVTELDFVANGFHIETDPGLASLNLANSLAGLDGVELSSPNWWVERTTR